MLFQGKPRASMKFHKEEKKEERGKRVGMKLIEQEKVAKMFLFLRHTLNYHGLHKVLVNAMHNMGFSDILSYNIFVVLVQSEFFLCKLV